MSRPGDVAVYRDVLDGRVFFAIPARVVVRDAAGLVSWFASGSPVARPATRQSPAQLAAGAWEPVESRWGGHGILHRYRYGDAHSLRVFWNDDGTFRGWYGNLEQPWVPSRFGFDTRDHILDVWNDGRGWHWKDEDEFAEAIELGLFTLEEADAVRGEGERVMRETMLPTGWEDWRPDPGWPVPELPKGWDVV